MDKNAKIDGWVEKMKDRNEKKASGLKRRKRRKINSAHSLESNKGFADGIFYRIF